ncbi:hypothetical protein Bbelb_028530 [Branchiostoma belcheri]|nr:hypothetical protein Bbelb_028530 [Branchiostoma belcheri]
MLNLRCSHIRRYEASDFVKDPCTGSMKRRHLAAGESDDLPDVVRVGVGARVMLCRNVNVEDGLVNGAFGTVTGMKGGDDHASEDATVYVLFDNPRAGAVEKQKSSVPNDIPVNSVQVHQFEGALKHLSKVHRYQIPLKLAWACTTHKVQGMTTDEAVISMKNVFASADVICLTETWLSGDVPSSQVKLENFTVFRKDRTPVCEEGSTTASSSHGGVAEQAKTTEDGTQAKTPVNGVETPVNGVETPVNGVETPIGPRVRKEAELGPGETDWGGTGLTWTQPSTEQYSRLRPFLKTLGSDRLLQFGQAGSREDPGASLAGYPVVFSQTALASRPKTRHYLRILATGNRYRSLEFPLRAGACSAARRVPGSEVTASLRRISPNGARSDFNSELKSIRRPRGAKNRPAAVGKPAGLRPGENQYCPVPCVGGGVTTSCDDIDHKRKAQQAPTDKTLSGFEANFPPASARL